MISSISPLSSSSISLLFGTTGATETTQAESAATKLLAQATVEPANLTAGANAIGKIIEIVAGMKASDAKTSVGMFTMDGAERIDGADGEYSLTKTGTGKVISDAELAKNGIDMARQQAAGSGPEADLAKAYLKAIADGTMQTIDLSDHGVSATLTQTNSYYADGRDKGQTGSYSVTGLSEFLKSNTYEDPSGYGLRDKATGKYATISQNGTKFSYNIF